MRRFEYAPPRANNFQHIKPKIFLKNFLAARSRSTNHPTDTLKVVDSQGFFDLYLGQQMVNETAFFADFA